MNREEISQLKKNVGKAAFAARLKLDAHDRASCPFHGGDDGFTLWTKDGEWFATCRSGCGGKTWDVIKFVMDFDKLSFKDATAKLLGRNLVSQPVADKPKAKRMTEQEWLKWGREISPADIERLAKSRKDKTAGHEAFRALGCRVKGDVIGFPYTLTTVDPVSGCEVKFFTIKTRHLDIKDEQRHECCVDGNRFYNIDTVNPLEAVYAVEGEPDVAIMEEAGFRTVGVPNTGKFNEADLEILCEATHIFLIGDQKKRGLNDPGPALVSTLQSKLPPHKTSRITFSDAHDACQLASVYGDGFATRIEQLSEEAQIPWVTKNVRTISKISRDDPKWLVERMIPWGGVSIFCGKQGAQKTLFALQLAKSVAFPISTDFKFFGREVYAHRRHKIANGTLPNSPEVPWQAFAAARDVPVLYIDRENPESEIGRRLRWMGLLGADNFRYWGDGDNDPTPDVTDPRLEDWMRKERGLIVFDSLQDWYGDTSEIDNTGMARIMHGFRRLARLGAGVAILHHDSKYGEAGWRGATSIVSIPEMSIGLRKAEEDAEIMELRQIRFRMCKNWEMDVRIHWDDENKRINFGIARDETGSQTVDRSTALKEAEKDSLSLKLEAAVLKNTKASARELEKLEDVGRNRIPKLLARRGWKFTEGEWQKSEEETTAKTLPFS